MRVKLKTFDQLIEEFGFKFDGTYWRINKIMLKYLGKEIEVEELENKNWIYTHYDNEIKCYWHESWFEPVFIPIEFINEDEFEI